MDNKSFKQENAMEFTKEHVEQLEGYIKQWFKYNLVDKKHSFKVFKDIYKDRPIKNWDLSWKWKIFFCSGVTKDIDFYKLGYNDDHITTALNHIFKSID